MNTSRNNVERVYSGKHGCMCGCLGNYHEDGPVVSRIYNKVMNNPSHEEKEFHDCRYAVLKTDTRNYVVYFKD